jgi:hypothetical protein
VASGVVVGVIFPVASGLIWYEFKTTAVIGLPPWIKKFGTLLLFSLITALICIMGWRATHPVDNLPWFTAFLLGFGWESAIEKLHKPDPHSENSQKRQITYSRFG